MDVLIVGSGDVGRWFGSLWDDPVAFADAERAVAERAAGDVANAAVADLAGSDSFDVVAVAVPMRVAETVIADQADRAERALVDFTGSMTEPLETMAEAAPDLEQVSFHPLFAPEHAPGRVAKSVGTPGPTVDAITRALVDAGNTIVPVEAGVHDDAMGTVQGRVHAAVLAFGLARDPVPEGLETPVYEEMEALRERVTSGSPGVYADIQDRFDGAEALERALDRLHEADRAEFESLYDDAG
ncbi:MAG: prephenate dehydrogenase/arogenate dehydrogenase family protein [Halodesulfurarchaeum sp.]|nr:prephenate dehydrogenase/arogenate dehydrogenase family protein [Halodesulfurarchaeum sp.]